MQCSEVNVEVTQGLSFGTGWDSLLAWQRWNKFCARHVSHLCQVSQDDSIKISAVCIKVHDSGERHLWVLRATRVWSRQRQQWLRLRMSTNRANTSKEGHSRKGLCELLRLKTCQWIEVTSRMDCFTELLVQPSKPELLPSGKGKEEAPVNTGNNSSLNY